MPYKYTNTPEPVYTQPPGEYVLQCVAFELGLWPDSGDAKIELKLLIEGTGTTFKHTISPTNDPKKQFQRWQTDQMLQAFELVGPQALNLEIDIENADWLAANVVGQRCWAKVKIRIDKRDVNKRPEDQRKYNDVDRWLIGRELPPAPEGQPQPEPADDNKPQF